MYLSYVASSGQMSVKCRILLVATC